MVLQDVRQGRERQAGPAGGEAAHQGEAPRGGPSEQDPAGVGRGRPGSGIREEWDAILEANIFGLTA